MAVSTGIAASGMCSCCARAPSPLASPSTATATAITASATRGGRRCRSPAPVRSGVAGAGRILNRIAASRVGQARAGDAGAAKPRAPGLAGHGPSALAAIVACHPQDARLLPQWCRITVAQPA